MTTYRVLYPIQRSSEVLKGIHGQACVTIIVFANIFYIKLLHALFCIRFNGAPKCLRASTSKRAYVTFSFTKNVY